MRALFSRGQCGPCVVCGEERLKEVLGGLGNHLRFLGNRTLGL